MSEVPSLAVPEFNNERLVFLEAGGRQLATIFKSAGTKSQIARSCKEELGFNRFDAVGYAAIATVANHLACVGALPITASAYFAGGSSEWGADRELLEALSLGWLRGCEDAGASWGGVQCASHPEILVDGELNLAGSGLGVVPGDLTPIVGNNVLPNDEVLLVATRSVDIGGTGCIQKLIADLPDRYATELAVGDTLGKAALREPDIYVSLVESLLRHRLPITYMSPIDGCGVSGLLRMPGSWKSRIDVLPPVPALLSLIVDHFNFSDTRAYSSFNMGAGLAVYCRPGAGSDIVVLARSLGFDAALSGVVEEGPKQVVLEPLGITYSADELQLR